MNHPDAQPDPSQWLQEHGDALYRYARARLGDDHVAEDVVQDTLIKAYKAFDSFRGESSLKTWLFQILRNEVFSHFRRVNRHRQIPTSDEPHELDQLLAPVVSNQMFRSELEKQEFWQEVRACCEKLPEHLQATFLARLSHPDEKIDILCKELGLSASNFSVRLFRARLLLRSCLEAGWLSEERGAE